MNSIVPLPIHARVRSVVPRANQSQATPTQRGPRGAPPLLFPLLLCGLFACTGDARAVTHMVGPFGGDGGDWFSGGCPPDQNLGGVELRAGAYIDAVRPVCVISAGPTESRVAPVQPPFFGGPGGGNRVLLCPKDNPIVTGVHVAARGQHFITVSTIALYCGQAIAGQTGILGPRHSSPTPAPMVGHDEPEQKFSGALHCPTGEVAVGLLGRSGSWLDSVGLICGAPRLTASHVGGVPRSPGDRGIGQGATTVPAAPAPAKKLGRALAAPTGAGAAPLNQATVLAPPQSNPLAGGASLKQAVIPAPGAARSPLQKADPAALNAQPQASPITLPAQAPSALR